MDDKLSYGSVKFRYLCSLQP